MTPFIETFSGVRFQPLEPIVEDIGVEDIAHALAHQCRFSGHSRLFYSVAEHSVRVACLLKEWGEDEDVQLWGLMHDASEAYLVDLPTPLKSHPTIGEGYRLAEKKLMRAITKRFALADIEPERVRLADAIMLATEVRDLMPGRPQHWKGLMVRPHDERIVPWDSETAKRRLIKLFNILARARYPYATE